MGQQIIDANRFQYPTGTFVDLRNDFLHVLHRVLAAVHCGPQVGKEVENALTEQAESGPARESRCNQVWSNGKPMPTSRCWMTSPSKVAHGPVLVVLGPSGSGSKSTLLRTIAGLEPIQGGTISINNQVIDAGKPGTERAGRSDRSSELRTRIGMVFQSHDLFPNKNGARQHHHGAGCSCRNAISPRWRLKRSGCLAAWDLPIARTLGRTNCPAVSASVWPFAVR